MASRQAGRFVLKGRGLRQVLPFSPAADPLLDMLTARCPETGEPRPQVSQPIIPICMHCRRVQVDSGLWEPLNASADTTYWADLSHGLCPDCARLSYQRYLS